MDRLTPGQLVAIAIAVLVFVGLVIGLALISDDQRPDAPAAVPTTPRAPTSVDPSTSPGRTSSQSTGSTAPTPASTSPPDCETIPTLTLIGPDADVEMDLVFFTCAGYDVDGEAMSDPGFVPDQTVLASGTVSLMVEPAGSIAVAVAPWESGTTWSALAPEAVSEPVEDGTYQIELPTTGCSAIAVSLVLESGEGRFVGLAESALGACAAAAD